MTLHAEGSLDGKNTPLPPDDATAGTSIGRYALDKQFHGDLEATDEGEMLARRQAKGSAGYVAIEQVTGTLQSHPALSPSNTAAPWIMAATSSPSPLYPAQVRRTRRHRGNYEYHHRHGKHSYSFDYTLPAPAQ